MKQPTYETIARDERPDLYALLEELVSEHHSELEPAKIQLVWRRNWKGDKDGRLILGQAVIPSREDRLTHGVDLRIRLNFEVYQNVNFSDAQKRALLDHELCHFAADLDDETGGQKIGADGLLEWRKVKHTIEEFHAIVDRHGMWKQDIASFVERAMAAGQPEQLTLAERESMRRDPVLADAVRRLAPEPGSGIDSISISIPSTGQSVTLTQEDRRRMDRQARARRRPEAH